MTFVRYLCSLAANSISFCMAYYDDGRGEDVDFQGPLAGTEEDEEGDEDESGTFGGEAEEEEGYE